MLEEMGSLDCAAARLLFPPPEAAPPQEFVVFPDGDPAAAAGEFVVPLAAGKLWAPGAGEAATLRRSSEEKRFSVPSTAVCSAFTNSAVVSVPGLSAAAGAIAEDRRATVGLESFG